MHKDDRGEEGSWERCREGVTKVGRHYEGGVNRKRQRVWENTCIEREVGEVTKSNVALCSLHGAA